MCRVLPRKQKHHYTPNASHTDKTKLLFSKGICPVEDNILLLKLKTTRQRKTSTICIFRNFVYVFIAAEVVTNINIYVFRMIYNFKCLPVDSIYVLCWKSAFSDMHAMFTRIHSLIA